MSTAMSSTDVHFQHCTRGRDCRCPAYVVNAISECPGQSFGQASGTHYAHAPPAFETAVPLNPSIHTGQYQAYSSSNIPPSLWTSQVNVAVGAPDAPTTHTQALSAAVASYHHFAPPTMAPTYPSCPPTLNYSQWEGINGANASMRQVAQVTPAVSVIAPIVESMRIDAVPGEERVYEIVTRVRF